MRVRRIIALPPLLFSRSSDRPSNNTVDRTGIVVAASRACAIVKDLESARKIHRDADADAAAADPASIDGKSIYVASSLIDSFAKCGSLADARTAFEAMESRNAVAWTSLIHGCAENGEAEAGIELFQRMIDEGYQPSARSIVAALKCCSRMARDEEHESIDPAARRKNTKNTKNGKNNKEKMATSLARGMAIHRLLHGSSVDIFVAASLIDMYASCGSVGDARRVFERVPCRNLVAWNAMILGYADQGDGRSSLELFDRLIQVPGLDPDARTIGAAIKACSVLAADLVASSRDGRLELGSKSSDAIQIGELLDRGRKIFSRAEELGCSSDVFLLNSMLDLYSKCGSLSDAAAVFDRIPSKTSVSWNTIMLGFVENGQSEQAIGLFFRVPADERDPTTFAAAFKACGSSASLAIGKTIHGQVCRCGSETSLVVATGIVDFYSKCGNLIDAQHGFDSMPAKNTIAWTALIGGYSRRGSPELVFGLFREMLDAGFKPDGATLVLIIAACSHAGLVARGRSIFREVLPSYGVAPSIEHYHALIDLLGRGNHLREALEVAETMPFKPSAVTWITLLSCCSKWSDESIARVAFQRLTAIDAAEPTAYVLMEKILANGSSVNGQPVSGQRLPVFDWD